MKIYSIKRYWKNIINKIRHNFGYFTEGEITQRKGDRKDIVSNVEKIWMEKLVV